LDAFAVQQASDLAHGRLERCHRLREGHVVEAFRQRRASGAQPQEEPPPGQLRQTGGEHRDGGGRPTPDVEHAGADPDAVGLTGYLGE